MKRLILVAVLAFSVPAHAQQVEPALHFTMSPDEANMMLNQLGEMKWKEVNPLLIKLLGQLRAQTQPIAPPAPPAPPPAPKE